MEPAVLRPFMGRLVPVLLKNMVYDEYDEEVQDAEAADDADHADDTDQEIKPFISRCLCTVVCRVCKHVLCDCMLHTCAHVFDTGSVFRTTSHRVLSCYQSSLRCTSLPHSIALETPNHG